MFSLFGQYVYQFLVDFCFTDTARVNTAWGGSSPLRAAYKYKKNINTSTRININAQEVFMPHVDSPCHHAYAYSGENQSAL